MIRGVKGFYFIVGVLLATAAIPKISHSETNAQTLSSHNKNIRLLVWQGKVWQGAEDSGKHELRKLSALSPKARRTAWQFAGRSLVHDLVGDDAKAFLGVAPILDILPVEKPSAFVVGGSTIVLTEGIIDLIESSDEFAFILAHELSHVMLGHTAPKEALMGNSLPLSDQLEREIHADLNAVTLLKEAGYDPTCAVGLLEKVSEALKGPFDNYPSLDPRIRSLKAAFTDK